MRFVAQDYSEITNETTKFNIVDINLVGYYGALSAAAVLTIFTLMTNLCTIILLVRYRPMQKSVSNLYILSLSLADAVIGVVLMILLLVHVIKPRVWSWGWTCDVWQLADIILSTVSLYSMCAIAFDRVWNLEKPLRVLRRSRRLARKIIFLIWIFSFSIWILYYLIAVKSRKYSASHGLSFCTFDGSQSFSVFLIAVPVIYVPAISLVGMFIKISVVVHEHFVFLRQHSNNPASIGSARDSRVTTPLSRTPEPPKRPSDTSLTSGYGTQKSPRSLSPRLQRPSDLAPLSEEKSSGRDRSRSEQITGKIAKFNLEQLKHLRVKNSISNPTRKESIRARRLEMTSCRRESLVIPKEQRSRSSSFRRFSGLSRMGSSRFSVIGIPTNLSDLLQKGISQQIRAAKAVSLILCSFLVCWLPFLILWPLKIFCPNCIDDRIFHISVWLNYLCSAINPLLYTLSSPRVRRVFTLYFFPSKVHKPSLVIARSGTLV